MTAARSHATTPDERIREGRGPDAALAVVPLPSPRRTFAVLAATAAALCGLSLLNIALGQTSPLLRLFDTAFEANIATWLSSAMWLGTAAVAYMAGFAARRSEDATSARWFLLAGCFLLLAIDETAQMHELTVGPAIDAIEWTTGLAHGPARLAAAALAGAALLAFAAWLWPWMRALPRAMVGQLLLAGAVFVGGALGLEVVSRLVDTAYLSPFEELCEMLGVALLLTALLRRVRD